MPSTGQTTKSQATLEHTALDAVFAALAREVAEEEAPRLFALVEEHGEAEDARVAGFGLAYEDRAEVTSVEGDCRLRSRSAENARALFEIGNRDPVVRRVHLVWLS